MITLLEIPPDSDYAIAQSPPTINRFESNLRINSKNWFHLIFICFVFRSSIRVRLLSNFIAQFTLQTFTVYKNTNVVIGVVCSTWHWLNWKRMARANPSYCNKTIHYAHKVLEWNIASVDLCAGALIIRRLALHFHAIRIPFESNASLRARNRKKRMTATATHARVCPHEERSTRNWPNNTYFNNIVCLILELLGVYRESMHLLLPLSSVRCRHWTTGAPENSSEWLFYEYFTNQIMFCMILDACRSKMWARNTTPTISICPFQLLGSSVSVQRAVDWSFQNHWQSWRRRRRAFTWKRNRMTRFHENDRTNERRSGWERIRYLY